MEWISQRHIRKRHCLSLAASCVPSSYLSKHFPSEYPQRPWPRGLRDEVGEMGEEPRNGRDMWVCRDPQRGSLPILVISDWRVCQEPIQLQLWTTTSIISLLRCLQWWSTGQLIGYKASLWGLKSWINSQVSAFVFLQVALPSITEFENGNKHLMSSTPYNTQYGLQAPPPATHS